MSAAIARVYEPDEKSVHYGPPQGLDRVTACGVTDWLGRTAGTPTRRAVTCWECIRLAEHFGYAKAQPVTTQPKGEAP